MSVFPTVTTQLLMDLVGMKNLNSSFGALTFIRGVSALLGPPLAGFLLDSLGGQAVPFFLAALLLVAISKVDQF